MFIPIEEVLQSVENKKYQNQNTHLEKQKYKRYRDIHSLPPAIDPETNYITEIDNPMMKISNILLSKETCVELSQH